MKKIILCTHIILFSIIAIKTDCSPLDALKTAKKQLEEGKKSIVEGKKGVIDGYIYIKSNVINTMNDAAIDVQNQIKDLDSQKNIASDMLNKKLPALLGIATAAGVVVPPVWALVGIIPTIEAVLWDIPKTLGAINSTLDSIVKALHDTVNIINPVNEKLNPANNPPALAKFDIADKKFLDAIKKIDEIIEGFEAALNEL